MATIVKDNELEVLVDKTLTIRDHEGDRLVVYITYNSTTKPEFAALLQIDLQESGTDGTWMTADDLEALSVLFAETAAAMRVAKKVVPKRFK